MPFFDIKHTTFTLHKTLSAFHKFMRKYLRKLAILEGVIIEEKSDK